jgi:predicted ATPase/class 3 adenylate cyclase
MYEDEADSATQTSVGVPNTSLTFLFTDVEGSTPLWERHEATMRQVAARHDALLDAIIIQHRGRRVKERGEGDSIFATFPDPADAVAAALAINRAVHAEPWPAETPIRVRMSLHTGVAHFREGDYYGTVVNRCARIRGLGHGGQILLSHATAVLVQGKLPVGANLRSLGRCTLKGLSDPEEVFQLCHPDLPDEFPPLLSREAPTHNLPPTLTNLIGRESEQGEILALLGTKRLVTLTGAGGVGKTRLALAVAAELVDHYQDGVWLVELAALADASLVPGTVAQALGVRQEPARPLPATLQDHLKDKQILLVLDNCEHLVGACATLVGTLLRAAPGLRILATSREGLQVGGEHIYRVPSLSVPDPRRLPPLEQLGAYEAIRLFVARAQARRDFVLDEQNGFLVATICARLDGIPLAIELAAARAGSMPIEVIAARLDHCIKVLTGGPRDVPARQQTLRAALDWSWDLLDEPERIVLRRLAVFAGGWTLAAAEAVCAGETVETWEVLDLLAMLESKSLVILEEARYRLLEPVRQYAADRLLEADEAASVRERHLASCLSLAEEAEPALQGPEQADWAVRLEQEHDNLRVALNWTQAQGEAELELRLAVALSRFWFVRGHLSEGRGWLEGALAGNSAAPAGLRAAALKGAGNLAYCQGEYGQAAALYEEALALFRALGDKQGIAGSLTNLGIVADERGEHERAAALFEEAVTLARERGDTRQIATTLGNLAAVWERQSEYGQAAALYEEALALFRALGDTQSIAVALDNLGLLALLQCEYGRALTLYEEALALFREIEDKDNIAGSLSSLGAVAERQGEYGRATVLLQEGPLLAGEIGARDDVAEILETMSWVAAARSATHRAAQLAAAAEVLREALGVPLGWEDRTDHERAVQAMREALGEEAFAAAWAEGRAMSPDQAISLALADASAVI